MQIQDEVRKCVVFVGYESGQGMRWVGTAHLVCVPGKGDGYGFPYLVTAKHLIDGIKRKSSSGSIFLRVNLIDGGWEYVKTEADDWGYAENSDVDDVAVTFWVPHNDLDFRFLSVDMAATSQVCTEVGIGVGDEIAIAGLFVNHRGNRRNVPIVRIGNIAAMPEEPVDIRLGALDAYLVEARSIGGLSGSPVFARPLPRPKPNKILTGIPQSPLYWLGMVHGHYDIENSQEDSVIEDEFNKGKINMGIAIVIPVDRIINVINSKPFLGYRDKIDQQRMRSTR